jgi:hypothetical protein
MTYVEYYSNNSGGRWWLTDDDYRALEKAGWYVLWGGVYFCHSKYPSLNERPEGKPEPCANSEKCPGHRRYDSAEEAEGGRWLRSLARNARRDGLSLGDAIREWEQVTGKDSTDLGCHCCGAPHSFYLRDADGKHLESYYPEAPSHGEPYSA